MPTEKMNEGNECLYTSPALEKYKERHDFLSQEIEKRKQFDFADVNTGFMTKSKQRKERNE